MENRNLLIVDDDNDLGFLLSETCRSQGFETKVVSSVFEAKIAITEDLPVIIILDNTLPDGYGTDLLPFIETNSQNSKVLLITGDYEKPEYNFNGDHQFMRKPFNLSKFLSVISNMSVEG
jgi:two-component system, OmpR family, response regulator